MEYKFGDAMIKTEGEPYIEFPSEQCHHRRLHCGPEKCNCVKKDIFPDGEFC